MWGDSAELLRRGDALIARVNAFLEAAMGGPAAVAATAPTDAFLDAMVATAEEPHVQAVAAPAPAAAVQEEAEEEPHAQAAVKEEAKEEPHAQAFLDAVVATAEEPHVQAVAAPAPAAAVKEAEEELPHAQAAVKEEAKEEPHAQAFLDAVVATAEEPHAQAVAAPAPATGAKEEVKEEPHAQAFDGGVVTLAAVTQEAEEEPHVAATAPAPPAAELTARIQALLNAFTRTVAATAPADATECSSESPESPEYDWERVEPDFSGSAARSSGEVRYITRADGMVEPAPGHGRQRPRKRGKASRQKSRAKYAARKGR